MLLVKLFVLIFLPFMVDASHRRPPPSFNRPLTPGIVPPSDKVEITLPQLNKDFVSASKSSGLTDTRRPLQVPNSQPIQSNDSSDSTSEIVMVYPENYKLVKTPFDQGRSLRRSETQLVPSNYEQETDYNPAINSSPPKPLDFLCHIPNTYYAISSECDSYIECRKSTPRRHTCPDGLFYNPKANWPQYPCAKPSQVTCGNKKDIRNEEPVATELCPHRFGIFPSNKEDCKKYIVCHKGTPYYMTCPDGLAFNPIFNACDSPKNIPKCNTKVNTQSAPPQLEQLQTDFISSDVIQNEPLPELYPRTPEALRTIKETEVFISSTTSTQARKEKPKENTNRPILPRQDLTTQPIQDNDRIEPTPELVIIYPENTKLAEATSGPLSISQQEGLESVTQTESSTYNSDLKLQMSSESVLTTYEPVAQPSNTTPEEPESSSSVPSLYSTASKPEEGFVCRKAYAYYAIAEECDTFVECKKSIAMKRACPDGLLYNPELQWPQYPCVYPSEVTCKYKTFTRKGKFVATEECPRQNGIFPTNKGDCGTFTVCLNGAAHLMTCPYGLAFNPKSNTCDWPENVPTCTLDVFHGFTCPEASQYDSYLEQVYTYRYKNSCKTYIACLKGEPRLLQCDPGLSFNQDSGRCINSSSVINCEG